MEPTTLGSLYALATALCWAVAVILFKHSGQHLSPVALNVFKNALGLSLLLATLGFRDAAEAASRDDVWWLLASGALGIGIADVWLFAGLNRLGASLQAIADGVYAPMVVGWSYLLLGEVLGGWDLLGGLLIVGSLLIVSLPGRRPALLGRQHVVGLLYSTAAILLMAFSIVWIKPALERQDVVYATAWRMAGGLAVLVVYLAFDRQALRHTLAAFRPQAAWKVAIPGAVVGAYLAILFWVAGFKYAPAGVAGILNQTSGLFMVLLAAPFAREPLTTRTLVAVSLGFVGSVLVLWI